MNYEIGSCEICGKSIKKHKRAFFERKTCSVKCRQAKSALKFANKVMKKLTVLVIFLSLSTSAFANTEWHTDWDCVHDCYESYSWGYCKSACSYPGGRTL